MEEEARGGEEREGGLEECVGNEGDVCQDLLDCDGSELVFWHLACNDSGFGCRLSQV